LNDWHVCVESFEVCLLAFTGGDRLIEIVADVLPRTGAVSERVPQKIGTSEIGGAAQIRFAIRSRRTYIVVDTLLTLPLLVSLKSPRRETRFPP
jgi:hypothetical protein